MLHLNINCCRTAERYVINPINYHKNILLCKEHFSLLKNIKKNVVLVEDNEKCFKLYCINCILLSPKRLNANID